MKYFVLMLALLAGPASSSVDTALIKDQSRAKYVSWSYACELTMLCDGTIQMPKVSYEAMDDSLRGWYDGTDTVHVNWDLPPGVDRMSTIIHEMIHYLHVQSGLLELPAEIPEVCWSEETAFTLVDQWLISQGFPNEVRGPDWWRAYWHCEPYYDPDWDLWSWMQRRFGV